MAKLNWVGETTWHSTREMFDPYNIVEEEDAQKTIDQLEGYFSNGDPIGDQVVILRRKVVKA